MLLLLSCVGVTGTGWRAGAAAQRAVPGWPIGADGAAGRERDAEHAAAGRTGIRQAGSPPGTTSPGLDAREINEIKVVVATLANDDRPPGRLRDYPLVGRFPDRGARHLVRQRGADLAQLAHPAAPDRACRAAATSLAALSAW